jgi:hypothetical protein
MRRIQECVVLCVLGLASSFAVSSSAPAAPSAAAPPAASSPATAVPAQDAATTPEMQEPGAAESPESRGLSASFDATIASKYLFQGLDYSSGRGVLQPNLGVAFGDFSVVGWGNYQPDLGQVNEIDLSLKYSRSIRHLSLTPGYTYLHYPNREGWDPSQELFLDAALETHLNPSLSMHYDFDSGDGLYATLGVSQEVRAPVSVAANLFYQKGYYDMTGFPAMELKASAARSLGNVTVSPAVSRFVTWNNRDFRDAAAVPSTWLFALNIALPLPF